jgi:CxxC motif-containing protein (DUF1111 family)
VTPRRPRAPVLLIVAGVALASCNGSDDTRSAEMPPAVVESGGATTTFDVTTEAFARSAANLGTEDRAAFAVGNAFFNDNWVIAPGSTAGRDGLGPVYNALSCSGCHLHDGRAQPPSASSDSPGLLFRLSVPGEDRHGGPVPEPTYGGQFNDLSIPGVPSEGTVDIEHTSVDGTFADGTKYTLDRPSYQLNGALGPLAKDAMVSPRIAPAMTGVGLLEAVPASDVIARADPDDVDRDGISGRPNMVWDLDGDAVVLGRFGWKASQPSVRQQVAGAFQGDIGITSSLHPDQPCTIAETACVAAPNGGAPELDEHKLDRVTFYSRTLGVPARRDIDKPAVADGAKLFAGLGCSSCHTPTLTTGETDIPELAHQEIHPYTDLLLHDMGPDLADGRPDFGASGSEWRTAPLWGIGLVSVVDGHTRFMHDGRARSIEEAILWHGGEAAAAQLAYRDLSADDRAKLLAFVGSL